MANKPKVAVHKFASCDGCQLAFLTAGEALLTLAEQVELVHFAEAGPMNPEAEVDIAFIEGSICTPHDEERIRLVRNNSKYLITIGACATAGGLQALRNLADGEQWLTEIYATPEYVNSLATSTPISQHVNVDLELWGCPVNVQQVMNAIRSLLHGAEPAVERDKVCMECKRKQTVCVMVTRGEPCMGPVTRTGCGAICPTLGRDCYACYGPAENINTESLGQEFRELGLLPSTIGRRFHFINSGVEPFTQAGLRWKQEDS